MEGWSETCTATIRVQILQQSAYKQIESNFKYWTIGIVSRGHESSVLPTHSPLVPLPLLSHFLSHLNIQTCLA
jgi:hypothetical protein